MEYLNEIENNEVMQKVELLKEIISETETKLQDLENIKAKRKDKISALKKDIKKANNSSAFIKSKRDQKIKSIIADLIIDGIEKNSNVENIIHQVSELIKNYNLKVSVFKNNNEDEKEMLIFEDENEDEEFNL